MKIVIILGLSFGLLAEDAPSVSAAHTAAMQSEVVRLRDLVNMLYAQIAAMQSEAKAAEAKATEKAAIDKRSKELGCEVEPTTGACKPK